MKAVDGLTFYPVAAPKATALLLHGAGASVQSAFFAELLPQLQAAGVQCWTANFVYMQQTLAGQRKVAPKADKLLPELTELLDYVRQHSGTEQPIWLIGKSMGGRLASLWLVQPQVDLRGIAGALVLGYPLCPPAKAKDPVAAAQVSQQRTAHFSQLQTPLLLAQGSRDTFGSAAALAPFIVGAAACQLLAMPGADHDFTVRKQDPFSRAELFEALCRSINWQTGACRWINSGAAV